MEVRKDIFGYEGLYQVSDLGKVRSIDRQVIDKRGRVHNYKGKKIRPQVNGKGGYLRVPLCKYCKRKRHLVHRLVYYTFMGGTYSYEGYDRDVIMHLDHNPNNNALRNLARGSQKENMRHEEKVLFATSINA